MSTLENMPVLGSILAIIFMFLYTPLTMGFYTMIKEIDDGEVPTVDDLFNGFRHFGSLALLTIIYIICLIPLFLFFGIGAYLATDVSASAGDTNGNLIIGLVFLFLVISIYLFVSFILSPMLVVFHGKSAIDSLKLSFKIVNKNWWIIFLFLIITAIISLLGILGLIIGVLFTFPSMMAAHYYAFKDVTMMGVETEEDDILDHIVEEF
jgi:uncharacterized membrane protein